VVRALVLQSLPGEAAGALMPSSRCLGKPVEAEPSRLNVCLDTLRAIIRRRTCKWPHAISQVPTCERIVMRETFFFFKGVDD